MEAPEEPDPKELARARARALRLLGPAPLTGVQLTERLGRRGFSAEVVARVVQECIERGWVDDLDYARRWIERRREQGYGRARIAFELRHRGIEEAVADLALGEEAEGAELAAARRAAAKKVRGLGDLRERRDQARLARHLSARGFNSHTVRTILDEAGAGGLAPPAWEPGAE